MPGGPRVRACPCGKRRTSAASCSASIRPGEGVLISVSAAGEAHLLAARAVQLA